MFHVAFGSLVVMAASFRPVAPPDGPPCAPAAPAIAAPLRLPANEDLAFLSPEERALLAAHPQMLAVGGQSDEEIAMTNIMLGVVCVAAIVFLVTAL